MPRNKQALFKRPFRTHGGAVVPHRKKTAEMETVLMPPPEQVVLSMQQHVGAPCKVVVKVGDTVKVGQVVGDSDGYVTAPVHASVSGTVSKITKLLLPGGNLVEAVVIDSDGLMTPHEDIRSPIVTDLEGLIHAARTSGLVGLGGAGFPAHVKLKIPEGKTVDTLIVNAAECEPYLTADYREIMENSESLMSGIMAISELLKLERVLVAIEDNKPKAIELIRSLCDSTNDPEGRVQVMTLRSQYPQGAEKVLIQACTGRKVPKGKLPSEVGCLVMNVASVSFLAQYLKTGMPLISKRITVDGSAIAEPKNVTVPIGTPISKIVEFAGGYNGQPKKLLMGGPMMGYAIVDDEMPILKQNNGILALAERDAVLPEPTNCIRCGRCVASCPMSLMPTLIERQAKIGAVPELERLSVVTCMECGCCAYACPAGRQLVQSMRLGKAVLRDHEQKAKEA